MTIVKFPFTIAAGMDYEELSEVVVIILPNSTESCVAVVIIDDHNLEDTETFSVQLTSTDTAVRVNSTETTVCIRDDDSKPDYNDVDLLVCKKELQIQSY